MKKNKQPLDNQIAIYQVLGDEKKIRVRIEDENVWLTQKLIAELFDIDVRTVNEHLKNIFSEQELDEISVIRKFRITANDGKVSHEVAEALAMKEYEIFRIKQDKTFESDFDREVKKLLNRKK